MKKINSTLVLAVFLSFSAYGTEGLQVDCQISKMESKLLTSVDSQKKTKDKMTIINRAFDTPISLSAQKMLYEKIPSVVDKNVKHELLTKIERNAPRTLDNSLFLMRNFGSFGRLGETKVSEILALIIQLDMLDQEVDVQDCIYLEQALEAMGDEYIPVRVRLLNRILEDSKLSSLEKKQARSRLFPLTLAEG